jgi:hypothetical protein
MKQEKLNKSGRFDKLYELLAQHEKYETACEVKAKLFDQIAKIAEGDLALDEKMSKIFEVVSKNKGASCVDRKQG